MEITVPNHIKEALKSGDIKTWNEWVKTQKSQGNNILIEDLDLSGIDFRTKESKKNDKKAEDIKQDDFPEIIFSGCTLHNCKFTDCIIKTMFDDATFTNCKFIDNHFICSNFDRIKMDETSVFSENRLISTPIAEDYLKNYTKNFKADYQFDRFRNIDCAEITEFGKRILDKGDLLDDDLFDKARKAIKKQEGTIDMVSMDSSFKLLDIMNGSIFKRNFITNVNADGNNIAGDILEAAPIVDTEMYMNFNIRDKKTEGFCSHLYAIKFYSLNDCMTYVNLAASYISKEGNFGFYVGPSGYHFTNSYQYDTTTIYKNPKDKLAISGGFDYAIGRFELQGDLSVPVTQQKTQVSYNTGESLNYTTPVFASLNASYTFFKDHPKTDGPYKGFLIPREIFLGLNMIGPHKTDFKDPASNLDLILKEPGSLSPRIGLRWSLDLPKKWPNISGKPILG